MLRDDFDYPTPQRATNWTLQGENKRQTRLSTNMHEVNRTSDIPGAQAGTTSSYRGKQFTKKPDLFGTADISGAKPTQLVPTAVNKQNDRIVNNRDIDHSYPESKLFSTPRVVNPLEPDYPLPVVRHRQPTPPPMRHPTMQLSDIPGTKAKPQRTRTVERNPLDYSDVPLSRAGAMEEARKRKTVSKNLETRDINGPSHADHARGTNPLEPSYKLTHPHGDNRGTVCIGPIDGSKPKGLPPARKDRPLMSLRSDDIDGARPGNHLPYPKQRRDWKKTCDVSDIDTRGKRTIH